jgi:hypothetical protein
MTLQSLLILKHAARREISGTPQAARACGSVVVSYLEGELVAGVLAAVDDVEGGHRQHELGVARQVTEVLVQRQALKESGGRGWERGRVQTHVRLGPMGR